MERERSQQGARTAEGAPPSPPDMAARDADPQQQSQEASDESQDGSNVPAKGHSLLQEAIAAVAGAQMGFHALLLPLQLPAVAPNKVLFMQCMFALNAVQVMLHSDVDGMCTEHNSSLIRPGRFPVKHAVHTWG